MSTPVLPSPHEPTLPRAAPLSRQVKLFLITLTLFVLTGMVIWHMPHGYSVDLARIGTGRMAIVLVYDQGTADSRKLLQALSNVRSGLPGQLDLLVANVDSARGAEFAVAHGVVPATLVLFNPDGSRFATLNGVKGPEALREALIQALTSRDERR